MLKEERELRREVTRLIKYAFKTTPLISQTRIGQFGQMIHDLSRAVREDERKRVMEDRKWCADQAAAIRGRK